MSANDVLQDLLKLEREQRTLERTLFETHDPKAIEGSVIAAIKAALANRADAEATPNLERLADLCPHLEGPDIVDALFLVLNDDEPSVRLAAGEALLDAGYERYAEVARGVERLLDSDLEGPAKMEAPLLLAEIGEPGSMSLVRRFLESPDADVVAGAIEAAYRLADPSGIEAISKLENDPRRVMLDDHQDESATTIGDLAGECLEALQDLSNEG